MRMFKLYGALGLLCAAINVAHAQSAWEVLHDRTVSLQSPAAVRSVRIESRLEHINAHSTQLQLQLPDGNVLVGVRSGVEQRGENRLSWFGKIDGEPDSTVLLTREGEHLAGYISSAAGIFEISPRPTAAC